MRNKKIIDDLQSVNIQPKIEEEKTVDAKRNNDNIINRDEGIKVVPAPEVILNEDTYGVKIDEIANKNGKYIFTIGNVNAGKSTFQAKFFSRLWERKDIVFLDENNSKDTRGSAILNKFIGDFKKNKLPDRTQKDKIQEFPIAFNFQKKEKLEVNLLEISGENISTIIPSLEKDVIVTLGAGLDKYLQLNIDRVFILISDSSQSKKYKEKYPNTIENRISEEVLFNAFLQYLLKNNNTDKKIKLMFVATKWDLVKDIYENINEYLNDNFPQILALLVSDEFDAKTISFSIGKVKDKKIIEIPIDEIIDEIIEWIYYSFIKKSLWNKLLDFIRSL